MSTTATVEDVQLLHSRNNRRLKPVLNSSSNSRYNRANSDGYLDAQFEDPRPKPTKIPYRAITLAVILFVGGTILIVLGALLISGHIDAKYSDRTWPLIFIGTIMFIPGFYHVRIAYYAYRGYSGYSFDDIPDFDDYDQ